MNNFDDVFNKYEQIFDKYTKLYILLIKRLKKYKVQMNFENSNFKELVHAIDTIPTKEYDFIWNFEPSDIYTEIKSFEKNITTISNFNENLTKRTIYYIKWLRYYLIKKGISVYQINNAKTLEDHILLIDFLEKSKETTINITLNNDNTLYYGNNVFNISVIDEDGKSVTDGMLYFYKDGLRIIQELDNNITITINDLNQHTYSFQYYHPTNNYQESNIVELELTAQPMPIIFTATLDNLISREYINIENTLKGYINDEWVIQTNTTNIHGEYVDIQKTIKIYDNENPREIQTNSNEHITFEKHNNENNNEPIHVIVEVEDNPIYNFNTQLIEFDVNILYPYYSINPLIDYTGKSLYEFEITFYNELTNEITNNFDEEVIDIILLNSNEEDIINETTIITNGTVTINYDSNMPIGYYQLNWVISNLDINRYDQIQILSNYVYSEGYIYLIDEPYIELLNDINLSDTNIVISNYTENTIITIDEETQEEIQNIEYIYTPIEFELQTDENNRIIIPNSAKEVGDYKVDIINNATEEIITYYYYIRPPYTYYHIDENASRRIYYINIQDIEHFNIENITDYIKICEYGTELEYLWSESYSDIIIPVDTQINDNFKGINTFWMNINNYQSTEKFKLLGVSNIDIIIDDETGEEIEEIEYGKNYEIVSEIELGENEIDIACYKWNINHINVTITHNGSDTNYSVDSNNEDFIFTHIFPEAGDYIITVSDLDEVVTFNITLEKNILKIQDFKFNDKVSSDETLGINNCLGFGFNSGNKINEDITIIFYCDNPNNILTTKIINAQDTEYHLYTDMFLGTLEEGVHTIYATYSGDSVYYQPFTISKEVSKVKYTKIVYDKEFNTIGIGNSIQLSLLTLDSQNNIITDGYYIVNNQTYNLNDDIVITPEIVGEYYINIQYKGENGYQDSYATLKYIVESDSYDYYASSLIGNNENNGTSPIVPVKDIQTLLSISQPNDLLCLMAGEYSVQTITRNTIIYGYYQDNIEDIKANIQKIAPGVTLVLNNISLDTGNGYTNLFNLYRFVNSGDETVELSTIPGENIIPEPIQIGNYEIIFDDEEFVTSNGNINITGVIMKNNTPIGDKLIKIYKNDDALVRAGMSLIDGTFNIPFNTEETVTLTVEITNCKKNILIKRIIEKHILLNGNEELKTLYAPELIIDDNELKGGGVGYILDPWCGSYWELELDAITKNDIRNYISITKNGTEIAEQNRIKMVPNGNIETEYNNIYENFGIGRKLLIANADDFTHLKVSKLDDYTIKLNIGEEFEAIYEKEIFAKFFNDDVCIGIGHWDNTRDLIRIKNIFIKEILPEQYYTNNTQKIKINSNESLGKTQNDYPEIKPVTNTIIAFENNSGYLYQGFKNTKFWEIRCQVRVFGENCGVGIHNKGTINMDRDSARITSVGELFTWSHNEMSRGVNEKTNAMLVDQWNSVVVKKIAPKIISLKINDGPEIKTRWVLLPNYEELCIGPQTFGDEIRIKNIEIDNIKTKSEIILFEDSGMNEENNYLYIKGPDITLTNDERGMKMINSNWSNWEHVCIPYIFNSNKNYQITWRYDSDGNWNLGICDANNQAVLSFPIISIEHYGVYYYDIETDAWSSRLGDYGAIGFGAGSEVKLKYINKKIQFYLNNTMLFEEPYELPNLFKISHVVRGYDSNNGGIIRDLKITKLEE